MGQAYVIDAVRTAVGKRGGALSGIHPVDLGAYAWRGLIDRVGVFLPKNTPVDQLGPGEVGFITAQIKEVAHAAVGDTITDEKKPTAEPL